MTSPRAPLLRRFTIFVGLALVVGGGFQPEFFRIFFRDRTAISAYYEELPYRKIRGLRTFLLDVERRTAPGDSVALVVASAPQWDRGYYYAYQRAPYLLAGRSVLPVVDSWNRVRTDNVAAAKYLACLHCDGVPQDFEIVFRAADGILAVRR